MRSLSLIANVPQDGRAFPPAFLRSIQSVPSWSGVVEAIPCFLPTALRQVIAKNALKQDNDDEFFIPDTVDVNDNHAEKSGGCPC